MVRTARISHTALAQTVLIYTLAARGFKSLCGELLAGQAKRGQESLVSLKADDGVPNKQLSGGMWIVSYQGYWEV